MSVRLVNGTSKKSGRVEVLHQGNWGTVCDNEWDMRDANVVCRMLGFPRAIAAYRGAKFGPGRGLVRIGDVGCSGSETNIAFCPHKDSSDCSHSKDAGVLCRSAQSDPQPRIPCK